MKPAQTPDDISGLLHRVAEQDGIPPVNESATLVLDGLREGSVATQRSDGEVIGLVVTDLREGTLQACVDPAHRRRGVGSAMLRDALAEHPDFSVWAFGNLKPARALARSLGLVPVRHLLKLSRPLSGITTGAPPAGYRLDTFTPADAEDVVRVNAAAFNHHPEQGRLTLEEFEVLAEQPWFDPAGLILARDEAGKVVGFHWVKRHDADTGEVYVIGVDPDHEGRGLGKTLLEAGLAHLRDVGCKDVRLYVEAVEERAVRMYESGGFARFGEDVSYRLEEA